MIDFNEVQFDDSNPESRCACMLLLDNSGSMMGEPIQELNAGLQVFKEELMKDALAMLRVEVAIITFGPVEVQQEFVTASDFLPPTLLASADTPMGTAINLALDKVDERKQVYKSKGVSYYRPWIFLITDGAPTDGKIWRTAAQRIHETETRKGVSFYAVGVEGANMNLLNQLSAERNALKLKGLNFREMFMWLSNSMIRVSASRPGDKFPMQNPIESGWTEGTA